ncbi:unnamed protein product [Camellia sinensis]
MDPNVFTWPGIAVSAHSVMGLFWCGDGGGGAGGGRVVVELASVSWDQEDLENHRDGGLPVDRDLCLCLCLDRALLVVFVMAYLLV